jgi:hypothetical protein
MTKLCKRLQRGVAFSLMALLAMVPGIPGSALASSHQDAPLAIFDPAANTTDVYAFVVNQGRNGVKSLVVALGVWPFEEPGIGPNKFNFDDNVRYEIHVATGNDVAAGAATFTYRFQFKTTFRNPNTILQSYLGVIQNIGDANQNLIQTYTVTKIDRRTGVETLLGTGLVPPNNQGNATPFYNQGDNGENPAKMGVATAAELDRYTNQAITPLSNNYVSFAGQRDDGFSGDIQAIFDLLKLRQPGKDAQGGFNLHLMALEIPVTDIGGEMQVAGVYATTSRLTMPVLRPQPGGDLLDALASRPKFVQVARQGNPLFNEGLVAIADKDLYSRTSPTTDRELFRKYAESPELARLINALVLGQQVAPETNRADIVAIFIPDLIKVDLSTPGIRFAGNGPGDPRNPDDAGFSRLGIFGGDVLESRVAGHPFRLDGRFIGAQAGRFFVPGGWPNGRRFGDDVTDIAITALISDLRNPANLIIRGPAGDGVDRNDMGFNKTFPYESTPQNGRNHSHP